MRNVQRERPVGEQIDEEAVHDGFEDRPKVFGPGKIILLQAVAVEPRFAQQVLLEVLLILDGEDYDGEAREGQVVYLQQVHIVDGLA